MLNAKCPRWSHFPDVTHKYGRKLNGLVTSSIPSWKASGWSKIYAPASSGIEETCG